MDGISIVTDSKGKRTGLLIDLKELTRKRISGKSVAAYIHMLEDIEDVVDAVSVVNEPTESWSVVKNRLKDKGKLSKDV